MPQPPAYDRLKDFTENFGSETDHSSLNAELDKASNSINDIRGNLAILQADDGKLNPDVITADSISTPVRDQLSASIVSQVQGSVDAAAASASAASASATTATEKRDETLGLANAAAGSAASAATSAASIDPGNLVHRSGNENVAGLKAFTESPVVPDLPDGDDTTKAANAKYARRAAALLLQSLGLSGLAGAALKLLRVKADESGYEFRTASQLRGDIGAADDTVVVKLTGNQTVAGTKTFSSPPAALNTSKAWVNFNGTTGAINGTAHNVSSVTDVATGNFTVNFSSALANVNYVPSVSVQNTVFSDYGNVGATMSTTQLSVTTARGDTGSLVDVSKVFVNVMGS